MKLLMYGLDIYSMSEEEQYNFKQEAKDHAMLLSETKVFSGVEEVYLLHDENQFEIYLFIDEKLFEHGDLLRRLADYSDMALKDVIFYSYSLYNEEAISHLFKKSFDTSQLLSSQFFTSVIQNGLKATERKTIGPYFKTLFRNLFDFMFEASTDDLDHFNVVSQILMILRESERVSEKEADVMIVGANLDSLYLSYQLKKLGVKSVTLAARNDEELLLIERCLNELDNDLFNGDEDFKLSVINLNQPNYKFAVTDIFVNLVVGWSDLKSILINKIQEIRLTPKSVVYASFYKDDHQSPFNEYKLSLPVMKDNFVQSEEMQEAIRLAAESSYKRLFK